jgi:hypothetical protein
MYQEIVEQLSKNIDESDLVDEKKEYYKSRLVELTKTEEENEKIKETLESFVGAPVDAIKVFFDTIDAMLGAYAEGGAQGVMDAAKLVTDAVDEAVE